MIADRKWRNLESGDVVWYRVSEGGIKQKATVRTPPQSNSEYLLITIFCSDYGIRLIGQEDILSVWKKENQKFEECVEAMSLSTRETDPTGRDSKEPGAKLDGGKVRVGLMVSGFVNALEEVARISTYGAEKYSDNGWLEVPDAIERYMDALYRHMLKFHMGEEYDPDSGLPHLAHAAWNALAILQLNSQEKQ